MTTERNGSLRHRGYAVADPTPHLHPAARKKATAPDRHRDRSGAVPYPKDYIGNWMYCQAGDLPVTLRTWASMAPMA